MRTIQLVPSEPYTLAHGTNLYLPHPGFHGFWLTAATRHLLDLQACAGSAISKLLAFLIILKYRSITNPRQPIFLIQSRVEQ
jgi:hypothetical protein